MTAKDSTFDSVLLVAFGGPERMEDVRPFLANVLRGRPAPPERVEAVVHHYELLGGRSPLNEITMRQAAALEAELRRRDAGLRVFVGMRNWHPFLADTMRTMVEAGCRRTLGFILSAQQSEAGWERYQQDVVQARGEVPGAPDVEFIGGWHVHPGFVAAMTDRLRSALQAHVAPTVGGTREVVFTAHSIPASMASSGAYAEQVREGAELVARACGVEGWSIAYQSRSGNPRDPWLEPDILDWLRDAATRGVRSVVVVPIGFVCDHVEVLYDLDIEARQLAGDLGIDFVRVQTVNDHPLFVTMMADVLLEHAARSSS